MRRWTVPRLPHRIGLASLGYYHCPFALLSVGFLLLCTSTTAFGVTTYTDTWGSGDDQDTQYVIGCSITDGDYDWEYHHTRADVTLTSPMGRSDFQFSEDTQYPTVNGQYPYARAEAVLIGDESDLGEYSLTTQHTSSCPVANFGSSLIRFPVGGFRQTYQYRHFIPEQGMHWYSVSCIGPCTSVYQQNRFFSTNRGPWYVCGGIRITFFGTTCLGGCAGSLVDLGCF